MLIRPGRLRWLLTLFLILFLSVFYFSLKFRPPYKFYENLYLAEQNNSLDLLSKHAGTNPKFVKFKQLQGAGFNNQAQEILLFHHLALLTSRIYVYQPLVWRPRGEDALVPLSAFLPGVTRASLSSAVFDQVCPEEEISHVQLRSSSWSEQWESAINVLKGDKKCIVVDDWILNWNYLASPGIWPIWSGFKSYLKTNYLWSPSILSVTERIWDSLGLSLSPETPDKNQPYLALHLRRGDFEVHCEYLASKKIGFTTWATLPILQPSIYPPAIIPSNASSVIEHCYPPISRILSAVSLQAQRHPEARKLLILHDGTWDHPLVYVDLYKIRAAVTSQVWAQQQGWKHGAIEKVLTIDGSTGWNEHDWGVCIDVELARRATAFIGNGFSSLSTQVVALRMADGGNEEDITFISWVTLLRLGYIASYMPSVLSRTASVFLFHKHTLHIRTSSSIKAMSPTKPQIISKEELPASEAKWVTLEKIKYRDQDGKERLWEAATRKTRKESGIDAVAVLAILQPKDKSPPATVIIEQYRPPVDKFVVELPAGLIDAGETPEHAARRELKEETGYEAEEVIESSSLMVSDPGMSTANMKLIALRVSLEDENALNHPPEQILEPGEHIVRRIVKLNDLYQVLNDYSERGFVIDARLSHFAIGYNLHARLAREV